MDAGKLDRRITLFSYVGDVDSAGNVLGPAGEELAEVWAEYKPRSGKESQIGAEQVPQYDATFVIRYSTDVKTLKPKDWLRFEEKEWDIQSVLEVGRREALLIQARLRDGNRHVS